MDAASLAANRMATRMFIEDDEAVVTLIPHTRVQTPSGGFKESQGQPKEPQSVKLIYQVAKGEPDGTADGAVSRQSIVLVAAHDADVDQGDIFFWPPGSSYRMVVTGIHPKNGYELKADVVAYGAGTDSG